MSDRFRTRIRHQGAVRAASPSRTRPTGSATSADIQRDSRDMF